MKFPSTKDTPPTFVGHNNPVPKEILGSANINVPQLRTRSICKIFSGESKSNK